MIHALRFAQPGQHFEPRERRQHEEQDKHIHLHVHLHLSFRLPQGRSSHLSPIRMMRIFAALVAATAIAFSFAWLVDDNTAPTSLLYTIAGHIILAGLLLAWGAMVLGGLPLLVSAWRSKPRVLFLLAVPLLIGLFQPLLSGLYMPVLALLGFDCATRNEGEPVDKWFRFASRLSFVAVGGMVVLLLGGFLWCLSLVLVAPGSLQMTYPWYVLLPFFLGMCLAVIFAVHTLFSRPGSRGSAQPKQDYAINYEQPQTQYPEQEPPRFRSS